MNIISTQGSADADIVLLGEYPGQEEMKQNQPFVGSAGQHMRQLALQAGVFPMDVFMTYVIRTQPQRGIKEFIDITKKNVPRSAAYNSFEKYLINELNNHPARIIVAFGNIALYALMGHTNITKYRGSLLMSGKLPGKWIIPTLSPASALKMPENSKLIQFDLAYARQLIEKETINYDSRELIMRPEFSEVIQYLDTIDMNLPLAFDIEIAAGEVSHISLAQNKEKSIAIRFYDSSGNNQFSISEEALIMYELSILLQDSRIMKIAHNAAFDCVFLYEKYRIITNNVWDTMIAHAILYPDLPKNLALVTSLYTDVPYYKDEGKARFKHGTSSNSSTMTEYLKSIDADIRYSFDAYSALDAVVLPEIQEIQCVQAERKGHLETIARQCTLLLPILFMTERGLNVNTKEILQAKNDIDQELLRLQSELDIITKNPINPNSPAQLKEYFYTKKKARPVTYQGKVTTNETALRKLSGRGFKEASIILDIRRKRKLKSTYLDVKLDDRGRFRYSINPVGTRFGRMSSSKDIFGRGTNMQNLPPEMKRYLCPDENYLAYELDLSQAENRIVAYLGNEHEMMEAFENGEDIHSKTAGLIFNMSIDDVKRLHKEWQEAGQPPDPQYTPSLASHKHSYRDWGKRANHALNYGMGPGQASVLWECSMQEARDIKNKYFAVYPGVERYQNIIKKKLRDNGYLENLYGRRYYLSLQHPTDIKQGYSYLAQSTVADKINNDGVFPAYDHPNVELLSQVHDSIVIQISLDHSAEVHKKALLSISEKLNSPLTSWSGVAFSIPTGIKAYEENLRDGTEFSFEDLHTQNAPFISFVEHAKSRAS